MKARLLLLFLTVTCLGFAHTLDEAVLELEAEKPNVVTTWLRLPKPQLARFDDNNDGLLDSKEIEQSTAILQELEGKVEVLGDGETGQVKVLQARPAGPQSTHTSLGLEWTFSKAPSEYEVVFDYFVESNDNPRCIASFNLWGTKSSAVFDSNNTRRKLSSQGAQLNEFFFIGAEHILSGHDHLLFLAVLLLAGGGFWNIFKMVTAFTVAHSITLALAIFDVFTLPGWFVEPIIILSIAAAAAENIRNEKAENRWIVAAGFGLIHGMGFAGFLADLNLSGRDALVPLIGFNLGVEVGQGLVVVLLSPVLYWVFQQDWKRKFTVAGSYLAIGLSLWWFVSGYL